jgi:lysophospholipase L1-like esterase
MHDQRVLRRAAFCGALATAGLLAALPARAQVTGQIARPAGLAAPSSASNASSAPACTIAPDQARFDFPLPHTARLLAAGKPIKIIALGSSSTFGAGASSSAAAYPNRLAQELSRRFPGHEFTVLNRGVNGEEITDMLKRLDLDVLAEQPDLVLWQVGTNSVLRDRALPPHVAELHEGLRRLRASGADIVLIDPQYAPRVVAKANCRAMVKLISTTAKAEHVGVFHSYDLMQHWYSVDHLRFDSFVSPDGVHMNDWSYACLAKALGMAISEAALRPTAMAGGGHVAR